MKAKDLFLCSSTDGSYVAVVLDVLYSTEHQTVYLCYAKSRLFTWVEQCDNDEEGNEVEYYFIGQEMPYTCSIPEMDELLELYEITLPSPSDSEDYDIL